jgi:hypothetical protein
MKRPILLPPVALLFLSARLLPQAPHVHSAWVRTVVASDAFTGKVVGVADGDTISVMRGGRAVKIRLHGIDGPEKRQAFGTRAKQFTSDMAFGKEVTVRIQTTDRYGGIIGEASGQAIWWMSEYPDLIEVVSVADNASLSTSYRTGPSGKGRVKLSLHKKPSGGLILKTVLPKEAIFRVDPKTGKRIPSKVKPVMIIRDHDLDGIPDDFNVEPSGEPVYEEEFTKDGFIKFRNSPDHQGILLHWILGIGFSVNHFLYNIDSAMPR